MGTVLSWEQGGHPFPTSPQDPGPTTQPLSAQKPRRAQPVNQELEEVFVKEQGVEERLRILEVSDGHRAPAPPQNSSCDHPLLLEPGNLTSSPFMLLVSPQPSGQASHKEHQGATEELASIHSNNASSPGRPPFLEDGSPSPVLAFAASSRPNHSYIFKRELPEGCEKVRVFEEAKSPGPDLAFLTSCPDKNNVRFNPTGSAFCPVSLIKPLFPRMGFIFRHRPSSPGSPLPLTAPGHHLGRIQKLPRPPQCHLSRGSAPHRQKSLCFSRVPW